ncbi:MAG: urea carboxylase-associated family protein [Actinobacteria bacterium]|nr:urea carboxylase-associated family protein [Actinomycetota bacterium]MBU1493582.1 urea carboxylase-associated family protein [Actinomycetota bacterium]
MAVTELPGAAIRDETVPAKGVTAFTVRSGETVRVEDLEGRQAIDLICYNLDNLDEKFWAAHTAKLNGTIYITTGHVLFSDLARPMMTVVEDTFGVNDIICGSCSFELDTARYGVAKAAPGCMDLFTEAIAPWGLRRSDVPMCFNIFLDYPVQEGGRVVLDGDAGSKPGDYIDLRAEMDLLVAITACPQVINPCNAHNPTPIRVAVY